MRILTMMNCTLCKYSNDRIGSLLPRHPSTPKPKPLCKLSPLP